MSYVCRVCCNRARLKESLCFLVVCVRFRCVSFVFCVCALRGLCECFMCVLHVCYVCALCVSCMCLRFCACV